jgi:predicted HD superfamily hydrolase involved in NAD metabolism
VSLGPTAEIRIAGARDAVRGRLGPRSAAHCERTAATARALAIRHGVDPDTAEIAGMLHDWSRDESGPELLRYADGHGLGVLPIERDHAYLLHARVGADQVREAFPDLPREVFHSVSAHTVGAVPMSDLDKVVFLADMLEPNRDFPGVDRIRELAYGGSLDEAFREAYSDSVAHVVEQGRVVHPISRLVAAEIERETGRPMRLAVAPR